MRRAESVAPRHGARERRNRARSQEKDMSVLRQSRIGTTRGLLDFNGPLLAPLLYLFESVRSYIEERREAFDARFGTDTAAPVFERNHKPGAFFYVATTAS